MPTSKTVNPVHLTSPITPASFTAAHPSAVVQFCGYDSTPKLTTKDFRILAEFLHKNPRMTFRAYNLDESYDLEFLQHFPTLKRFILDCSYNLKNTDGLRHLPRDLHTFGLEQPKKKIPLNFLQTFSSLRRLDLDGQSKDLHIISSLTKLEFLGLRSITLPDLKILLPLSKLETLTIKLGGTKNLELLPSIGNIRALELWRILGLSDISPIQHLNSLEVLFLEALKQIHHLPPMKNLQKLKRVDLDLSNLEDITPLVHAKRLEEMVLFSKKIAPASLKRLQKHPSLKRAIISLGTVEKNAAAAAILALPRVKEYKPQRLNPYH